MRPALSLSLIALASTMHFARICTGMNALNSVAPWALMLMQLGARDT